MRLWPLLMMTLVAPALAAPEIIVLGLFKDRAVLRIDGERRVLGSGEVSPEGVRLISADSDAAVLEVDGQRVRHILANQIGAAYAPPAESVVRLWPNARGMYTTSGYINNRPVSFLVDTGATAVAMNEAEARRLGIDYRFKGTPHTVATASGMATAYEVTLDSVRVGDIQLRGVEAAVVIGNGPTPVLLGMSYLGKVDMQREGGALLLRMKH